MSPRYRAAVAATMSSVMILQVILMAGIILMSVLGNLLVVVSVMCVRLLRQPPNLLLLALAVTDLFVSLVVMPGESKATDSSYTQFKEVTTTLKASNSYLEGVVQIRHHHIKGNWNLSLTLPRSDWLFLSRRAPAGGGGRLAAASGAVRGLGVRRCVPLHLLHPLPHSNLHRSILILIIKQPQDDLISHQCLFSNQENMNS